MLRRIWFRGGGIFVVALVSAASGYSHTSADLKNEFSSVAGTIETVRLSIETENEPAVRKLMVQRLATLQLTQDILRNRILLLEGEAVEEVQVPVVEPDMVEVAEITAEIAKIEGEIAAAEASLETAVGINKAIIATRLESERLALAQLRLAFIGARYGTIASFVGADSESQGLLEDNMPTSDSNLIDVAWADPRYPDIDYSNPLFERAYNSGGQISGWWTIIEGRDGSLTAQNLSHYFPDAALDERGMLLQIVCRDDLTEIAITMPGGYLSRARAGQVDVVYRMDNGVFGRDEWLVTPNGDGAQLAGEAALRLLAEMVSARSIFVDIAGSSRDRQSVDFDLAGYGDVNAVVMDACSQTDLSFSRNDYRLLQTLLNIAGYGAGAADGVWGQNSARAMEKYQKDAGLRATGRPDLATLKLLGLVE